jgi:predicted LPLAT superfamily acyltransferase
VRARSKAYLKRLYALQGRNVPPFATYRHVLSFALSMIEKLLGWRGVIPLKNVETQGDDLDMLVEQLDRGEGAFLICSHLGNMEMLRSLTGYGKIHTHRQFTVHPVVDFSGTKRFNALLRELNPELMTNSFDANSIGVDTAIDMREKIQAGNLVAIAGDRTSANSQNRFIPLNFLGDAAEFPEGSFALANILKAPVYFIFAFRKKDLDITSPYEFHIIRSKTELGGKRSEQKQQMANLAAEYASHLEKFCLEHPYQWYNFYDFWQKGEKK